MSSHKKPTDFEKSLVNANIQNIETGLIENNLFGPDPGDKDENGIKNKKINVFFFIKKANKANAPYIVFLNGGPGFAMTDMFLPNGYNAFLPDFNIIFFDQRGTGLSEHPSDEVAELKYYSAQYIIDDAEKIRESLLGKGSKWTVFGQSFGGVLARKYIEYAPGSIQKVISHGSAKYCVIDEAVAVEIQTAKRLTSYFSKYPHDYEKIEKIKSEFNDSDQIKTKYFITKGKGIIHILAILYSIKSDEDFHAFLEKLDPKDFKNSYLAAIAPLAHLILDSGLLNQAVAQINLIGDMIGDELIENIKLALRDKNLDVQKMAISKTLFDGSVSPTSEDFRKLELFFKERKIGTDVVDLDKVAENLEAFDLNLDVFGGETDTLAINAIRNEEAYFKKKNKKRIHYHYSEGHHREWLTNSEIFKFLFPP